MDVSTLKIRETAVIGLILFILGRYKDIWRAYGSDYKSINRKNSI